MSVRRSVVKAVTVTCCVVVQGSVNNINITFKIVSIFALGVKMNFAVLFVNDDDDKIGYNHVLSGTHTSPKHRSKIPR